MGGEGRGGERRGENDETAGWRAHAHGRLQRFNVRVVAAQPPPSKHKLCRVLVIVRVPVPSGGR